MGPLLYSRDEGTIKTMVTHAFAKSQKVQTRKFGWQCYGHCFLGEKSVLLVNFMSRGTTINCDRYCETLRKLRRAIQNKRRRILTKGVRLNHDNTRPHMANNTTSLITEFGWMLQITFPTVLTSPPVTFSYVSCPKKTSCRNEICERRCGT